MNAPPIQPLENEAVVWSAETGTTRQLLRTLKSFGSEPPPVVKIDRAHFERRGNGFWRTFDLLALNDVAVFDDAKIWGTPREVRDCTLNHVEGTLPWMLNCSAGIVSNRRYDLSGDTADSLKQFADICLPLGVIPCGVTVLTTTTPDVAIAQFRRSALRQVKWYLDLMVKAGFTHAVCSPYEIRPVLERGLIPINPGIRPKGAKAGQQARFTTPTQAIRKGAKYIVVGSPITNGPGTPAENLAAIRAEALAATN